MDILHLYFLVEDKSVHQSGQFDLIRKIIEMVKANVNEAKCKNQTQFFK